MPVPADEQLSEHLNGAQTDIDALPSSSLASASAKPTKSIQELMDDFAGLKAEAEEHPESEGESDEDTSAAVAGADADAGGEEKKDKKKKPKKKKSKAAKAMSKLKEIANPSSTSAIPSEVITSIRNQILEEQGTDEGINDEDIKKALKAADLMKILEGKLALGNKSNTKDLGEHKFWKTQPVPQMTLNGNEGGVTEIPPEGPIDPLKSVDDVRKEPLALPKGYEWCTIDVMDEEQLAETTVLLSENYVEDNDASFRLNYSKEFFNWALKPPGYVPDWHVGVRVASNKKLVAFISGIPLEVRVRANTLQTAEINFLCVHKKLRSKRLAPVLIKEVTRRVNLKGVWQAFYTAGVVIPTPIGTCRYWHRNLNPPKLVDIGFTPMARGDTVARMVKRYAVPETTQIPGLREMTKEDVPAVAALLRKYMARFDILQTFETDAEVEHWFLSGRGEGPWNPGNGVGHKGQVVWAYVVEDPTTHTITDFVSFYSLSSLIMKDSRHDILHTAYLYYYATETVFTPSGSTEDLTQQKGKLGKRLNELVKDCLIIAKQCEFDVFNALTLMENNLFLQDQLFGQGDGYLNFYLFNWRCAPINGAQFTTRQKETSAIGVVPL